MADIKDQISKMLDDPESMEKILSIAGMLAGGAENEDNDKKTAEPKDGDRKTGDESSALKDGLGELSSVIPPEKMIRLISAFKSSGHDDKTRLVSMLKPFLSDEKKEKADAALTMLKLWRAASIVFEDKIF